MAYCVNCAIEFEGDHCTGCGRDADGTRREVNKKLQNSFYPSLAGLLGLLAGTHYYPPLDSERLLGLSVCVVFLPVVTHLVVSARKRLSVNAEWLQKLYLGCGAALLLLASCASVNGALDQSPAQTLNTVVIHKDVSSGKYSTTYTVWVPCWRPGKIEEGLEVRRDLYHRLTVGEAILVDIHQGVFGMPWYSSVRATGSARR